MLTLCVSQYNVPDMFHLMMQVCLCACVSHITMLCGSPQQMQQAPTLVPQPPSASQQQQQQQHTEMRRSGSASQLAARIPPPLLVRGGCHCVCDVGCVHSHDSDQLVRCRVPRVTLCAHCLAAARSAAAQGVGGGAPPRRRCCWCVRRCVFTHAFCVCVLACMCVCVLECVQCSRILSVRRRRSTLQSLSNSESDEENAR
jgi:hypothetical protein